MYSIVLKNTPYHSTLFFRTKDLVARGGMSVEMPSHSRHSAKAVQSEAWRNATQSQCGYCEQKLDISKQVCQIANSQEDVLNVEIRCSKVQNKSCCVVLHCFYSEYSSYNLEFKSNHYRSFHVVHRTWYKWDIIFQRKFGISRIRMRFGT